MTKTAEPTAPSPRWVLGSAAELDLVVPADITAPPVVRAASNEFEAAMSHYGECGRVAGDARRALKAAPLDDDAIVAVRDAERELEDARLENGRAAIELADRIHASKPGWLTNARTCAAHVRFIALRNATYASTIRGIRQYDLEWTGVPIGGSRDEGARLGYFETPLSDGSLGYYMRRVEDCLQAAIASCAQIPMHLVPDWNLDERRAQGVDPEQITQESSQQLVRWATRLGIVIRIHPVPPKHARRWIGIVKTGSGFGGDHSLLMHRSDVLFNPWLPPMTEADCLEPGTPDWGITLERL